MKFLLLLLLFCNSLLANQTIIELSEEEKEYLKNKKIIKICSIIDLKPIEFYENNQFQGINIDLISLISKKLNIKFENIRVSNFEMAQEYMKNGTCELLPTTIQNKNLNDLVDYTIPLFNYKLAIITQKNKPIVQDIEELINKTMAKKSSSETINLLKSNYPNIDIFETKSDYETFEAVNNNSVYYAIEPLPVVTYYMSKYALNNIFISKYTDISLTTKIAILKNNQILFNILNKTIEKIKNDEHTNIFNKWTNFSIKEPFDYGTISKILIGIFIILAILSYRQIILNKHNKALKLANNEIEEKNRLIAKQ